MASICSQAMCVICYLGEPWNDIDIALEALRHIGENEHLHIVRSISPSLNMNDMGCESVEVVENSWKVFFLAYHGGPMFTLSKNSSSLGVRCCNVGIA